MLGNTMISPSGKPLKLVLIKSSEPIERLGVTTFECVLTYRELVDHFQPEANSDVMSEQLKMQRDVDQARVNGLKNYWKTSAGAVFPSMTIFATRADITSETIIGGRSIVEATLPADSQRFICDGQGRTTFIQWLLANTDGDINDSYTVATKLILTDTDTLYEPSASAIIRQVFSDYHTALKKPSKSISRHFDTGAPFSRFINELMETPWDGQPLKNRIALHGKIMKGQLWTFQQFATVIQKLIRLAPAQANKQLADNAVYESTFTQCAAFLTQVGKILPLKLLDSDDYLRVHEQSMFTKAIFASALGFVGASLWDEMLIDETIKWEALKATSMPLAEKDNKYWQAINVTAVDGETGAIKIIKATDRRIASAMCRELRIYPCAELLA